MDIPNARNGRTADRPRLDYERTNELEGPNSINYIHDLYVNAENLLLILCNTAILWKFQQPLSWKVIHDCELCNDRYLIKVLDNLKIMKNLAPGGQIEQRDRNHKSRDVSLSSFHWSGIINPLIRVLRCFNLSIQVINCTLKTLHGTLRDLIWCLPSYISQSVLLVQGNKMETNRGDLILGDKKWKVRRNRDSFPPASALQSSSRRWC